MHQCNLGYHRIAFWGVRVSDPFGNTRVYWGIYRDGDPDIYLMSYSKNQWSEAIQVTKDGANADNPIWPLTKTIKLISHGRFSAMKKY